jgi:SAM-dependent methyltransferase
MPVPDNLLSIYQAEDVFEHVPLDDLPIVFDEIFRVLRPGGLFRFSVPDYRSDIYLERSLRDSAGHILFDPGGGGAFCDGKVVDGGHLWHPVYETVKTLFETSKFGTQGRVEYLHHVAPDGGFILREIDYSLGRVSRTPDFDERVRRPRRPLSIVVDAWK